MGAKLGRMAASGISAPLSSFLASRDLNGNPHSGLRRGSQREGRFLNRFRERQEIQIFRFGMFVKIRKLLCKGADNRARCVADFGFRISDFVFRTWGVAFGVLGFGFKVQGPGSRV